MVGGMGRPKTLRYSHSRYATGVRLPKAEVTAFEPLAQALGPSFLKDLVTGAASLIITRRGRPLKDLIERIRRVELRDSTSLTILRQAFDRDLTRSVSSDGQNKTNPSKTVWLPFEEAERGQIKEIAHALYWSEAQVILACLSLAVGLAAGRTWPTEFLPKVLMLYRACSGVDSHTVRTRWLERQLEAIAAEARQPA
jgi:hypothetical protein